MGGHRFDGAGLRHVLRRGPAVPRASVDLEVAVLQRDLAVLQLVEIDAVAVERLAGMIDAGDAKGAEQLVAGAMDARLRVARLAVRLALVAKIGAQPVLAFQDRAGRRAAGVEAPFEIVGYAGGDLLDIGLVEGLAGAAEQVVASLSHGFLRQMIRPACRTARLA